MGEENSRELPLFWSVGRLAGRTGDVSGPTRRPSCWQNAASRWRRFDGTDVDAGERQVEQSVLEWRLDRLAPFLLSRRHQTPQVIVQRTCANQIVREIGGVLREGDEQHRAIRRVQRSDAAELCCGVL